jgi:hypothetical protein
VALRRRAWGAYDAPVARLLWGWVEVPEDQGTSTSPDLKDLDDVRAYVVLPRWRRLLRTL